jgi:hypothetical protein
MPLRGEELEVSCSGLLGGRRHLWRFRTWSRMLQGRTGTGCPSYSKKRAGCPRSLEEVAKPARGPLGQRSLPKKKWLFRLP